MAKLLGKNIWAKRKWPKAWIGGAGRGVPRRTRSAQRNHEKRLWVTKDQEMPYYWHPTADIEEDYEDTPEA